MPLSTASKIGIGWLVISTLGIGGFFVAKNSIDKNRYQAMKSRERMRKANQGTYEPSPRFSK